MSLVTNGIQMLLTKYSRRFCAAATFLHFCKFFSLSLFRGITHSQPCLAASLPPSLGFPASFSLHILLICHHRAFRYEGTIRSDDSSARKCTLLGTGEATRTKLGAAVNTNKRVASSQKHLEEKGSRDEPANHSSMGSLGRSC